MLWILLGTGDHVGIFRLRPCRHQYRPLHSGHRYPALSLSLSVRHVSSHGDVQGAADYRAYLAEYVAYMGQPDMACPIDLKDGPASQSILPCTCGTSGEACVHLSRYPSVTIAEYGSILEKNAMMKKCCNRGPIASVFVASSVLDSSGAIHCTSATQIVCNSACARVHRTSDSDILRCICRSSSVN